jgi:hypothetical protein
MNRDKLVIQGIRNLFVKGVENMDKKLRNIQKTFNERFESYNVQLPDSHLFNHYKASVDFGEGEVHYSFKTDENDICLNILFFHMMSGPSIFRINSDGSISELATEWDKGLCRLAKELIIFRPIGWACSCEECIQERAIKYIRISDSLKAYVTRRRTTKGDSYKLHLYESEDGEYFRDSGLFFKELPDIEKITIDNAVIEIKRNYKNKNR